jgi:hypothetical protein
MRTLYLLFFLAAGMHAFGQSKSITSFRSANPESSNMFFYSSTLKMLNTENNPELAGLLKDIEEIRVLTWDQSKPMPGKDKVSALKAALRAEEYNTLMAMNEKGSAIDLYGREKHGKMTGFVAIVHNNESLVLIDLKGGLDVAKFMQLKQKLDGQPGNTKN